MVRIVTVPHELGKRSTDVIACSRKVNILWPELYEIAQLFLILPNARLKL